MDILGNLKLIGLGHISNARLEQLAADPDQPAAGMLWYNTTDGVYRGYDGTTVVTFASAAALAAFATGAGLEPNGTYSADATTNYLQEATSLKDADKRLDTALKALSDVVDAIEPGGDTAPLQAEIDAIEIGAGLGTDGTYAPNDQAPYIGTATSLRDADEKLAGALSSVSGVADSASTTAGNALIAAGNAQDTADAALSRAGGQMSGGIDMSNNAITNLPAPVNPGDAATKAFVEAMAAGLDFQADVLDIQVDDTLQPSLVNGARYIITNAGNLHADFGTIADIANGDIVQYDGEEFVIAYDVSAAGPGAIAWNRAAGSFYVWDGTTWSQFGGLSGITAGIGLEKTGNVLDVKLGDNITVDGNGALTVTADEATGLKYTNDQLQLVRDGTTLAASAAGVKVADAGITATQLAATAFGDGLSGGAGTAVSIKLAPDSGLTLDATGLAFDDTALDALVKKSGDTMTGALVLAADPAADLEAATKQYVDAVRTDLETAVEGSHFVYDGNVSAATHQVIHNIGSKYCNVTVVDSADNVIIPDSVSFDDANTLTVGFASAITCKVIVTGLYVAPVGP